MKLLAILLTNVLLGFSSTTLAQTFIYGDGVSGTGILTEPTPGIQGFIVEIAPGIRHYSLQQSGGRTKSGFIITPQPMETPPERLSPLRPLSTLPPSVFQPAPSSRLFERPGSLQSR